MIQLVIYLAIGILYTVLDCLLIRRKVSIFKWIASFFFYTIFINASVIGILILYLHKPNTLLPKMYQTSFALKYIIFSWYFRNYFNVSASRVESTFAI